MVQYKVLANAARHSDLAVFTDNIRQLEALARAGCIENGDAEVLKSAYIKYRALYHEAILADRNDRVDQIIIEDERLKVESFWERWMSL